MKKTLFFISLAVLLAAVFVNAHSLYLFGISLDFDPELKANVIHTAQQFLNTKKEPVSFDLDKGLIMAHFEPEQRNYVEINPLGYKVYGMRNENLKHQAILLSLKDSEKLTKDQGFEIANKFFDTLPAEAKSELKYNLEVSEVDDTYFYKWFRKVNGIIVAGEDFFVNVDAVNGNIIAWRLAIFDYPKSSIKTAPAVSMNVARKVADLTFNAPSAEGFNPYTIIYGDNLVWVNRINGQFYPFYVGVSAEDGSIAFTGVLPGEIPLGYNQGQELKVLETDFIKQIYNSR